jgi:hypothetical protein
MASVIRVRIRRQSPNPLLIWFNSKFAARVEAKALFVMVGKNGDTVESLRELISVPPEIETLLRTYAQFHPVESREIEMGLRFRERVLEEFERMATRRRPGMSQPS